MVKNPVYLVSLPDFLSPPTRIKALSLVGDLFVSLLPTLFSAGSGGPRTAPSMGWKLRKCFALGRNEVTWYRVGHAVCVI